MTDHLLLWTFITYLKMDWIETISVIINYDRSLHNAVKAWKEAKWLALCIFSHSPNTFKCISMFSMQLDYSSARRVSPSVTSLQQWRHGLSDVVTSLSNVTTFPSDVSMSPSLPSESPTVGRQNCLQLAVRINHSCTSESTTVACQNRPQLSIRIDPSLQVF